jgi:tetratricopeptide (TPR) repeat protein
MSEAPRGGKDSRLDKDPLAQDRQQPADQGTAGAGLAGEGRAGNGAPGDEAAGEGRAGDRWPGDRPAGDGRDGEGRTGPGRVGERLPDDRSADDGRAGDGPAAGPASDGTDTYALYRRGLDLLGRGSAAAAAQLLERAAAAEPGSRSVLEALARAQFDAGRYTAAAGSFRQIVEASPSDDYAQFGLGLALARAGNPRAAAEHLALAAAMRPDLRHYTDALRDVRATLRFGSR